eukprot:2724293-Amphidinium_carterae.1
MPQQPRRDDNLLRHACKSQTSIKTTQTKERTSKIKYCTLARSGSVCNTTICEQMKRPDKSRFRALVAAMQRVNEGMRIMDTSFRMAIRRAQGPNIVPPPPPPPPPPQ